jgi:hypothetical protein
MTTTCTCTVRIFYDPLSFSLLLGWSVTVLRHLGQEAKKALFPRYSHSCPHRQRIFIPKRSGITTFSISVLDIYCGYVDIGTYMRTIIRHLRCLELASIMFCVLDVIRLVSYRGDGSKADIFQNTRVYR